MSKGRMLLLDLLAVLVGLAVACLAMPSGDKGPMASKSARRMGMPTAL